MATVPVRTNFEASKNVYGVVWNEAGNVLDFSDSTFKALGSATTPTFVLTEQSTRGGGQLSGYAASLDLAKLNKSLSPKRFSLSLYERAGGSPNVSTDRMLIESELVIVAAEEGDVPITVELVGTNTTTQGSEIRYLATVKRNGRRLDVYALDNAATLALSAREHGNGANQFSAAAVTVRSDGDFEVTVSATPPATVLEADRGFQHTAILTVAGEQRPLPRPQPDLDAMLKAGLLKPAAALPAA
jgi:hypothetical protein